MTFTDNDDEKSDDVFEDMDEFSPDEEGAHMKKGGRVALFAGLGVLLAALVGIGFYLSGDSSPAVPTQPVQAGYQDDAGYESGEMAMSADALTGGENFGADAMLSDAPEMPAVPSVTEAAVYDAAPAPDMSGFSQIAEAPAGVMPDESDMLPVEMATPASAFDDAFARTAEDLPMPTMSGTPEPVRTPDPVQIVAPAPIAVPEPAPAERAIVQNAPVMDSLSGNAAAPARRAVQPMPPLEAVANIVNSMPNVRPLPSSYLTVKKDRNSGDFDSMFKVAQGLLKQGKYGSALQMFNNLLADAPKDTRLLMGRALCLQNMRHHEAALEAYEAILREDPKNLEALVNLLGLLKSQNPEMVVEKLTELRSAYPYDADILAQLAIAHGAMKSYPDALMYIEMAEALQPDNAAFLYNKAVILDKMGQTARAATLYRHLLRIAAERELPVSLPVEAIRQRLARIQ
jgi:Tfp pilus assembly protein PilF